MTDELIERVARAIKIVWDKQRQAEADASNSLFDYEPGPWEEWIPEATAAIAAMPGWQGVAMKLHHALALHTAEGCPRCPGDCSASNPPMHSCPFCGGEGVKASTYASVIGVSEDAAPNIWMVHCDEDQGGCELNIIRSTKDAAIAAWNTRAAIAAMPGWQGIESAPKDGTDILLYFPHRDLVIRGSWGWQGEGDWESGTQDWCDWNTDDGVVVQEEPDLCPSHWMPLPPAPEPKP